MGTALPPIARRRQLAASEPVRIAMVAASDAAAADRRPGGYGACSAARRQHRRPANVNAMT